MERIRGNFRGHLGGLGLSHFGLGLLFLDLERGQGTDVCGAGSLHPHRAGQSPYEELDKRSVSRTWRAFCVISLLTTTLTSHESVT